MHVTALLAEDHQLAAGIAQCPCVDGFAASVKIPLLRSARLLSLAVRDVVSSTFFRQEPIYVALASDGSPKSPSALMTRPEVMAGWQRITPDESIPFPDKFTARSILAFSLERPVRKIHRSTKPYLVVLPTYGQRGAIRRSGGGRPSDSSGRGS